MDWLQRREGWRRAEVLEPQIGCSVEDICVLQLGATDRRHVGRYGSKASWTPRIEGVEMARISGGAADDGAVKSATFREYHYHLRFGLRVSNHLLCAF